MTSLASGARRRAGVHRGTLAAAGGTDPGLQREVNEDRFHVDTARGVLVVIDGVGGQAAGGRAADVALSIVRDCLERDAGPGTKRIRTAITLANNEIHRLAATRAEWEGMACVLTIALVHDGTLTFGHVGDTRLYKIRNARIEKITSDHSPVGEREDAGELTELQAMRHPRRNEVYRDVGSDLHDAGDADFIESGEIAFEPDAALLLCTDGLTDLVDSARIARIVSECAGDPEAVVAALIDAANAAGGKDNITAVYAEGDQFAGSQSAAAPGSQRFPDRFPERGSGAAEAERAAEARASTRWSRVQRAVVALAIVAFAAVAIAAGLERAGFRLPWFRPAPAAVTPVQPSPDVRVVQPSGSIADAIRDAPAESEIVVEPGEYREQIVLKDRIRLVSRVPRAAVIRLPATAPDSDAVAIVATALSSAALVGFRIVGDSATPLAVGMRVENSTFAIMDVDISGATRAAIEFSGRGDAAVVGSDIHDNPGTAIIVRDGGTPRIAHNVFARNSTSERAQGSFVLMDGAKPRFTSNVFLGLAPDAFLTLDNAARLTLKNENWFVPVSQRRTNRGPATGLPQRNK